MELIFLLQHREQSNGLPRIFYLVIGSLELYTMSSNMKEVAEHTLFAYRKLIADTPLHEKGQEWQDGGGGGRGRKGNNRFNSVNKNTIKSQGFVFHLKIKIILLSVDSKIKASLPTSVYFL